MNNEAGDTLFFLVMVGVIFPPFGAIMLFMWAVSALASVGLKDAKLPTEQKAERWFNRCLLIVVTLMVAGWVSMIYALATGK
jgi:heme A synthase